MKPLFFLGYHQYYFDNCPGAVCGAAVSRQEILRPLYWREGNFVFGLFVMMVATGSIFFIESVNVIVWVAVMVVSRVGAALVEAMYEVYFFKKIGSGDIDLIALVRNMRPGCLACGLAWLCGDLGLWLIFDTSSCSWAFVIMLGLRPALALKDTK